MECLTKMKTVTERGSDTILMEQRRKERIKTTYWMVKDQYFFQMVLLNTRVIFITMKNQEKEKNILKMVNYLMLVSLKTMYIMG